MFKCCFSNSFKTKRKRNIKKLGGSELELIGIEFSKNKRGLHRKEDEEINTNKLFGLAISLLAKKVGGSYCDGNKPRVSSIRDAIMKLSVELKISNNGLSRATIDKKISEALRTLDYERYD